MTNLYIINLIQKKPKIVLLTEVPGPAEPHAAHRLGHHVHLLEVDQPIQAGLVALVGERHVLQQQGHKRDHRRLQLAHRHSAENDEKK